jgi:creatinine amidohydrolase/Fe(II)-dependent formamide hydrolase-like protein
MSEEYIATHAEYPSSHANDNVQSIALQGHTGTILSMTSQARTLKAENKSVSFKAKQKVGCYDCHNGPNPD